MRTGPCYARSTGRPCPRPANCRSHNHLLRMPHERIVQSFRLYALGRLGVDAVAITGVAGAGCILAVAEPVEVVLAVRATGVWRARLQPALDGCSPSAQIPGRYRQNPPRVDRKSGVLGKAV